MSYAPQAQARYDAKMAVYISMKLNRKTDADIIEALEASPNKQALIKEALRSYQSRLDRPNNPEQKERG